MSKGGRAPALVRAAIATWPSSVPRMRSCSPVLRFVAQLEHGCAKSATEKRPGRLPGRAQRKGFPPLSGTPRVAGMLYPIRDARYCTESTFQPLTTFALRCMSAFMGKILCNMVFALDPERAHRAAIRTLALWGGAGAPFGGGPESATPVTLAGLTFPNRIGLAAGLDKDAEAIAGLFGLGFGAVEVGTLTPRPQPGNPKPRLFRLVEDEAVINRMGF